MSLSLLRHFWPATALLALLSCHDAPRTNPFDPALTPAVELQVALDDTAGTATLTWTRYEGQQPFREYRVLRNQVESTRVDTLERISAVTQTTYADTSLAPSIGYEYRVSVVNNSGLEVESAKKALEGYQLGAIHLYPVEVDPQRGALVVRWNRYVGPDFHGYQLKRRLVGTDREEVLAEIAVVVDTSYVDTSVANGQGYAYLVLVQAGSERLQSNSAEGQLALPPVEITRADFSSTTASVSLAWTQYRGARFKGYQVLRRVAGLTPQVVREVSDLADTAFVDTDLSGNTEYVYRVVVVTERDEEVKSEEQSGKFHALVATWLLGDDVRTRGRLYVEPGDRIVALVYRGNREGFYGVWTLSFDPDGRLIEERKVSALAPIGAASSAVATSLGRDGQRFFGFSAGNDLGILSFSPDWQAIEKERPLFADAFPNLREAEKTVLGEVSLVGQNGFVDKVRISGGGRELFVEDFGEFPEGSLSGRLPHDWQIEGGRVDVTQGVIRPTGNTRLTRADDTWKNFRLEADAASTPLALTPSIQIGGDTYSRFSLQLAPRTYEASLTWDFVPPDDLGLEPRQETLATPFQGVTNVFYGLSLEAVDGVVNASVRDPMFWQGRYDATLVVAPSYGWASLALVGDLLAFARNDQVYNINQAGEVVSQFQFEASISEIRVWENPTDGQQWIGVCAPDFDGILINRVSESNPANWPRAVGIFVGSTVGPKLGPAAGALLYPISFDVGPDGRFYVLDAGNARIAVFDADRHYLTQWGHQGSDKGGFDFGKGKGPIGLERYFAGSIAVDSQGYIYVLDVFNKRIQKFAP